MTTFNKEKEMTTLKKEIQVQEGLSLDTELNRVRLAVTGSNQPGQVTIELDSEDDKELDKILNIDYDRKENKLTLRELEDPDTAKTSKFFLKVFTGKFTDVRSISKNAAASISDIEGNIILKSINGSIVSENCQGDISLESKNGRINVRKTGGSVVLVTKNGSIEVVDGHGTQKIATGNGSVKCTRCLHEKSVVNVKNGCIYYEVPKIEKGSFTINSKNGAIRMIVPPELPYNVSAYNLNGRFNFGLPGDYETGKEDGSKYIKAFKGSGKVVILIHNKNGSISFVSNKGEIMKNKKKNKMFSFDMKFDPTGSQEWTKTLKSNIKDTVMNNLKQAGIMDDPDEKACQHEDNDKKKEQKMASTDNTSPKMRVLQMLEEGIISKDDAEKLINAIKRG